MVVVVVEPGLADPDHPGRARQPLERRPVLLGHLGGVVGVDAHGGEDVGLRGGYRGGLLGGRRPAPDADTNESSHAGLAGPGQHLGAFFTVVRTI